MSATAGCIAGNRGSWLPLGKVLRKSGLGGRLGDFLDPDRPVFDREKSDPDRYRVRLLRRVADHRVDAAEERPPGRRRRPQAAADAARRPQLYRLGVLIAGAILLAVIFILVINNCRGDQKQSAYEGYMEDVGVVASESAELGTQLNDRLTTPGIKLEALRADVEGYQEQQEQILRRTQELGSPGPSWSSRKLWSRPCSSAVNGLAGLARGLQLVAQTDDPQEVRREPGQPGAAPRRQRRRLRGRLQSGLRIGARAAGRDECRRPRVGVRQEPRIRQPLLLDADGAAPHAGPGGRRTARERHRRGQVQPGGQELVRGEDNEVEQSADLAFEVLVENSGSSQETQVQVTLIIRQDPQIRKEQTIDVINPDETKTVRFTASRTSSSPPRPPCRFRSSRSRANGTRPTTPPSTRSSSLA